MIIKPNGFTEFLIRCELIDDVYSAMSKPDLSETVMAMLNIVEKANHYLPEISKEEKSEIKSTAFRNEGNRAYMRCNYQTALMYYNKALLYAPEDSRALKLAYSNRSALLHKVNEFSACLSDINTCFSLGCPLDIIEKLRVRKEDARNNAWQEKALNTSNKNVFTEAYFQLNESRNPQIPCASLNVGVIIENNVPKIVATNDIKVGTVIAVETAFVSNSDPQNSLFSCYYCHKMHLNLMPCKGCCYALFCDETCRAKCMTEYHSVECSIIEVLDAFTAGTGIIMSVKAMLKIKQLSKSWTEFIAASHKMGLRRIKTSSINEIYDSNHKFSLLNVKDDRHFLHGPMYNTSIYCAHIVHYLGNVFGFYPQLSEENKEAKRAVGRMLMFLSLYVTNIPIVSATRVNQQNRTEFHDIPTCGWFSLLGKLKNSCNANVLIVGLNKKAGLVTQQPIKRGTELTVSYGGHWIDNLQKNYIKQRNMFALFGRICNCSFCNRDSSNTARSQLTDTQRKNFQKLNLLVLRDRFNARNIPEIYGKLSKTLAFLCDVPFSEEYEQVYRLFRKCVLFLQHLTTENCILDHI